MLISAYTNKTSKIKMKPLTTIDLNEIQQFSTIILRGWSIRQNGLNFRNESNF